MNAVDALIDDAWELLDRGQPRAAADLARRALAFDPGFIDAYVVLAASSPVAAEAIALLRQAVRLGAHGARLSRTDSDHGFERDAYVRALNNLARLLWSDRRTGSRHEAIALARRALRLDRYDRAGTRYLLVSWEASVGNWPASARMARRCRGESRADACYWLALHAFRDDDRDACQLLDRALAANAHVPAAMLTCAGDVPLCKSTYAAGSAEEAALLADGARQAWASSPGALDWMTSRAKS